MLKGKDLILATRKFAKDDKGKSWYYTLSTLLILSACLFASYYSTNILLKSVLSIITGLVVVRMFVIYHDYLHHSILKDSLPARILFSLFGLYVMAPTSIWKRSHDYHHKHNSKLFTAYIGSYPIYTKSKYLAASKSERTTYLFIRHPLTILFGYFFSFMYGMSIRSLLNSPRKHIDSIFAIILHITLITGIFIYGDWSIFVFVYFIPLFVACAMGSYLFYAQHNFPDTKISDKDHWDYADAALLSSSYMDLNPVMDWFTANIGYHHIHHINAKIPFYNLPKVYEAMNEFQHVGRTSLSPRDIWNCLKLKVWDPDSQRMLTLKEVYQQV